MSQGWTERRYVIMAVIKPTTIVDDSAHSGDFHGVSVAETGGAASVTVELRDATVGGQLLVAPIIIPASGHVSVMFGGQLASTSVYVNVTGTGTLSGVLLTAVV